MLVFPQMDPTNSHGFLFGRFDPSRPLAFKMETGQETEHFQENVFRTPRHSLLRDQIFSSISKGFYLSPNGEIIEVMPPRGGAFWRSLEWTQPILEFLLPGVLVVSSPF